MASQDGSRWETMTRRRCLETSGPEGRWIPARGAGGETNNICMLGELADRGRETSLAFGWWLRSLYLDQLIIVYQYALCPNNGGAASRRIDTADFTRPLSFGYEPDVGSLGDCHALTGGGDADARLAELVRAFSQQAAEKWNGSNDMRYLSEKLSRWMPSNKALALDSRPSLSAVMDSINATVADGPNTRRILRRTNSQQIATPTVQRNAPPKLSIVGCHDRTLGVVLASLGCLHNNEGWPLFTSHIIFELFLKRQESSLTSATVKGDTGEPRSIGSS
ncbi:hypothetical protein FHL15_007511 [Xylaria flabelliformis]|uniref:3-phytase n=1 Tax=Xylaria flabelliformis TaxID=2512241 RepID=A0A553HU71_9PEZI|nr:hypothetical protein FHL15_007511 [Xylaria flabelliformis]